MGRQEPPGVQQGEVQRPAPGEERPQTSVQAGGAQQGRGPVGAGGQAEHENLWQEKANGILGYVRQSTAAGQGTN